MIDFFKKCFNSGTAYGRSTDYDQYTTTTTVGRAAYTVTVSTVKPKRQRYSPAKPPGRWK